MEHCRDCKIPLEDGTRWCRLCHNAYRRRRRASIKAGTWVPHQNPKKPFIKRTTPRPTATPTPVDVAWAAGFLEGEGCFSCYKSGTQRVSAPQKDPEPLHRLQKFFGGSISLHTRRPHPIYGWHVDGVLARDLMRLVCDLMSKRRQEQIQKALGAFGAGTI